MASKKIQTGYMGGSGYNLIQAHSNDGRKSLPGDGQHHRVRELEEPDYPTPKQVRYTFNESKSKPSPPQRQRAPRPLPPPKPSFYKAKDDDGRIAPVSKLAIDFSAAGRCELSRPLGSHVLEEDQRRPNLIAKRFSMPQDSNFHESEPNNYTLRKPDDKTRETPIKGTSRKIIATNITQTKKKSLEPTPIVKLISKVQQMAINNDEDLSTFLPSPPSNSTAQEHIKKSADPPHSILVAELPDLERKKSPIFHADRFRKVFDGCDGDLPLLAIAITGVYRSGKSFLLNLMVTYLEYLRKIGNDKCWEESRLPIKGLKWAGGKASVTHGIWMWSKPFIMTKRNGQRIAVALLDIQGLGDLDTDDTTVDNLIMYIGLQVCNVQIINLQNTITHNDLTSVKMCAEYAHANDSSQKVFDSLIFLARNHSLSKEFGEQHGEFGRIVKKAKKSKVMTAAEGISRAFRRVTCAYLPTPGSKVEFAEESDLLTVHADDIHETFLKHSKEMFQTILDMEIREYQTINNAIIDFNELEGRIERHQHVMSDPVEGFLEIQAHNAYKEAQLEFVTFVKQEVKEKGVITSRAVLSDRFAGAKKRCLQMFEDLCKFQKDSRGMEYIRKYKQLLEQLIDGAQAEAERNMLLEELYQAEQQRLRIAAEAKEKVRAAEVAFAHQQEKFKKEKKQLQEEMNEQNLSLESQLRAANAGLDKANDSIRKRELEIMEKGYELYQLAKEREADLANMEGQFKLLQAQSTTKEELDRLCKEHNMAKAEMKKQFDQQAEQNKLDQENLKAQVLLQKQQADKVVETIHGKTEEIESEKKTADEKFIKLNTLNDAKIVKFRRDTAVIRSEAASREKQHRDQEEVMSTALRAMEADNRRKDDELAKIGRIVKDIAAANKKGGLGMKLFRRVFNHKHEKEIKAAVKEAERQGYLK